jgi:hypothetical protein
MTPDRVKNIYFVNTVMKHVIKKIMGIFKEPDQLLTYQKLFPLEIFIYLIT